MLFQDKISEIDRLKGLIDAYGKLPREVFQKINYKFRLDWNYYSNRMEGNTLSIEETKSVMIGNINVHNKPLKDVMEIKGHDEAIQVILGMGKGALNISETRIKELHKLIMYEESPVEKEKIGNWKNQPNHIINYRDEKFDFADPYDVPDKMHQLINWLNAEKEGAIAGKKKVSHPVELAFEFHLKYLTIHPFYDGNGRTARILTNLILISYGYPPIYIKDEDKKTYYRCLADVQAYGADKYLLFDVMGDYLLRSLNIALDAIAGKEIGDTDDLDKKILLLEAELGKINPDDDLKIKYSKEAFIECYETWMVKLIGTTIPVIQKFNKLFTNTSHHISIQQAGVFNYFINEPVHAITTKLREGIDEHIERIGNSTQEVKIQTFYGSFVKGGLNTFGCNYSILVKFGDIKYEVFIDDFDEATEGRKAIKTYERLLHQSLTEKEINDVAQMLGNTIYKHIDYYTRKNGLRK